MVELVETTEQTTATGISASSMTDGSVYATQILATTVRKNPADPIFLGYTPLEIKNGRLYKYYIGVSPDVSKAKEYFRTISKTYSDAFVVKVVDGTATRVQ